MTGEANKLIWYLGYGGHLWHITKPHRAAIFGAARVGLCGARPKWGWETDHDPYTGPESAPPIERHSDHGGMLTPCQRCLAKAVAS